MERASDGSREQPGAGSSREQERVTQRGAGAGDGAEGGRRARQELASLLWGCAELAHMGAARLAEDVLAAARGWTAPLGAEARAPLRCPGRLPPGAGRGGEALSAPCWAQRLRGRGRPCPMV
jgi:hypothetical protein